MSTISPLGRSEWALLLTLSVLWGGSFLFAGVAVREIAPLVVVFGRVFIAGLALLVIAKSRGLVLARRMADWRDFAIMALFNNVVPFSLIFWALQHIEAGLASIFNATTPFFTVVLAQALTKDEKINLNKVVGVLLGISGVAVLIGAPALQGVAQETLPSLACVGAAVSYALSSIWARRFRAMPVLLPATGQLLASSVMLVPVFAYLAPWEAGLPSAAALGSLAALALFSTALAYLLYFRILRSSGATNISLVTLLVPASASVLGWLVLGETLPPEAFLGLALIALGIAAMDGRPARWLRRRFGARVAA